MGFSVPIAAWLRGPLRLWAEDLLSEVSLSRSDTLRNGPIRQAWNAHIRGDGDYALRLWTVLMYQQWLSD